jgi:hypothetical protein
MVDMSFRSINPHQNLCASPYQHGGEVMDYPWPRNPAMLIIAANATSTSTSSLSKHSLKRVWRGKVSKH